MGTSVSALNYLTAEKFVSYRAAEDLEISPLRQEHQKSLCEGTV